MKRILPFLFALALPFLWLSAAHAQATNAVVVPACGTPPATYAPGANRQLTQDTTGRLCDGSSGTVTGTVTANQGGPNAGGIANAWTDIGPVSAVTGSVSAVTITNSSAQAVAPASRRLLSIDNESATATIACAFGASAALNTAGSFTIPPNFTRTWTAYPVPADAVNCISSAATSAATIEVN